MMATIPLKLKDTDIKKIDYLVKIGRYKSRNQAIRSLIDRSLKEEALLFEEDDSQFKSTKEELFRIWEETGGISIKILNKKISLVDRLQADRNRY
jgi:Arc/MetJ-type ribon-helix-helix transcriptional regulator